MPHPTDTFKSITCGKLRDLDPARAYDLPNRYPLANIYESLLTYSSADVRKLDPVLARAVPRIDNGLIDETGTLYRFPLRSGVLFHDKSTVTPADVRYSLLRLLFEDAPGSPSPILLRAILGIEHSRDAAGRLCIDPAEILRRVWIEDDVLLVRLARPFAPFVRSIASWLAVMPEHWAVANGEAPASEPRVGPRERESFLRTHTNGTGPFQLTRIDFSAQNLEMERFDEYWQGPAKLSKVMVHCSDDYPVVRDLLLAGEVDSIAADHRHQPELRTKPGLKLYERLPQLATRGLLFNFGINPESPFLYSGRLDGEGIPPDFFTDPHVRKAFAYAFDMDACIDETFNGKGERLAGPIPSLLDRDAKAPQSRFNIGRASEELKCAWDGRVWESGFRVGLGIDVESRMGQIAARILSAGLRQIGDRFRIQVIEAPLAQHAAWRDVGYFPIFDLGWFADYADPDDFVFNFMHSRGYASSAQRFSDPAIDEEIERAARTHDEGVRLQMYRRLQSFATDECLSLGYYSGSCYHIHRAAVCGWTFNPALPGTRFYRVYKEEELQAAPVAVAAAAD